MPHPPVFLHVGFTNTGTTSLQRNFFAARDDIFFGGEPYGERGGLFTAIKSFEDFKFDTNYFERQCRDLVYAKSDGRPIVISDENLCDTPQLYFGPYAAPRDIVGLRLQHFFPSAKIIFTIRDQRQYALSAYFNIKRNSAFFDHVTIPEFSTWLNAMLSRERAQFMQNLDFREMIRFYSTIFGRDNICILPLEMISADGTDTYLRRLCDFMKLPFSQAQIANYREICNQRMSKRRELVAELLHDDRFSRFYADLSEHMRPEAVEAFLDTGPRAAVDMEAADEEKIRRRVGLGNWLLSQEFDLDLGRYGYLMAVDNDFTERQLTVAQDELEFQTDIDRLMHVPRGQELIAQRQASEIARLRVLAMELMTVRQSPVWRTVERLDRVRRFILRGRSPASVRQ
jgi:hypothetical protein